MPMEVVAFSIFYGVVATSGSRNFAQSVLQLLAGREVHIRWILFVFLLCLSAATGVLIHRLFVLAEMLKQDHDVMPGQLSMLRAVVANLPDLIYVKDMNSRFLLANQATANAMGAGSGSALLGKSDSDFYPEELASGFFMDERKIMLSGQPLVNREENIPEPNGQIRTIMTTKVPLRDSAGKVIGIIGIGSNITQLKAVEAALMEAREELEFKAAHDSLTSLLNRGAILELLVRELARCARVNGSTAVLLGDLDHFKKINDQHGHPIGDEVLRAVACRLVGTVRAYDLVGRYGGEEFMVVLPGCSAPDALLRAEQLREAISASPVPTAHGAMRITISIGVLATQDRGQPTADDILREVDAALYAAKASGRNRCALAAPPVNV
jgi:diguanylate cyclase (GGDEF)-like protein/PAS domain S-box-containing protein